MHAPTPACAWLGEYESHSHIGRKVELVRLTRDVPCPPSSMHTVTAAYLICNRFRSSLDHNQSTVLLQDDDILLLVFVSSLESDTVLIEEKPRINSFTITA